jgi:uncharacterized protein YndB with AHSA1/START domain
MTTPPLTHATFVIERSYPVDRSRVFAAFADPEIKARWFSGPEEWGPDEGEMDFRVGGHESSRGGPPGGPVITMSSTYHDIVDDERLVFAYEMDVDGARISVSLTTIELHPVDGGTRLVLTEQGVYFDGPEGAAGREEGSAELIDKLGAELARQVAEAASA